MLRTFPKQTYCENWTEVSREIRVRVGGRQRTIVYGSNNTKDEGPDVYQGKCKSYVVRGLNTSYLF
jgi:hypothetical protein